MRRVANCGAKLQIEIAGRFVGRAGRDDDEVGRRRDRHDAEERPERQLDAARQERDPALQIGLDDARGGA
jgi:hypothetical protein